MGPDLGVDGEELGQTEVVVVVVVQAGLVDRRDERFSHVGPIHRQGTGDVELLVDHLLRTHRRHRYNICINKQINNDIIDLFIYQINDRYLSFI